MAVSYTCPNPECGVTLKTPNRVPPGKKVKCPKCGNQFIAEPEDKPSAEARPGTFGLAAEDPSTGKKKTAVKGSPKGGGVAEPPKPAAAPPAKKSPFADEDEEDDESIKKGYGVVKDSEEEIKAAEKNKPKFGEIQDKFKKSARG